MERMARASDSNAGCKINYELEETNTAEVSYAIQLYKWYMFNLKY